MWRRFLFLAHLLSLVAVLLFFPVSGQKYPSMVYQMPGEAVVARAIAETPDGRLWVGADTGLFRVGATTLHRLPPEANAPTVAIRDLATDGGGNLWIVATDGLYLFNGLVARRVSERAFWTIVAIGGRIFLTDWNGQSWSGPLHYLDIDPCVKGKVCEPKLVGSLRIHGRIAADARQRLWFQRDGAIGTLLDPLASDPAAAIQVYGEPDGIPRVDSRSSIEEPDGTIWVLNDTAILSRKRGEKLFRPTHELPRESAWGGVFQLNASGRLLYRSREMFALRTDGRMRNFELNDISSSARTITATYCDSKGNLWIGDNTGVLYRMIGSGDVSIWNQEHGLRGVIDTLRQAPSGTIWAGGSRGLFSLRRGKDAWDPVRMPFEGTVATRALDFQGEDPIVHANGKGAYLISAKDLTARPWRPEMRRPAPDRMTPWHARAFGHPPNTIRGEWEGPKGRIKVELAAPHSGLRSYTEDREGRVWLATLAGLFAVHADGSYRQFAQPDGLLQTTLQTIAEGPDGALWVGYDFPVGFSRFDVPKGVVRLGTRLKAEHYLPGQAFAQYSTTFFGVDAYRQLWRGTNNGVFVTDGPSSRQAAWFPLLSEDGWPAKDTAIDSFLLADDGAVLFSTLAGVVRIAKSGYQLQRHRPVMLVEDKTPERRPDGLVQLSFTTHPASELRRAGLEYRIADGDGGWVSVDSASFAVPLGGRNVEVRVRESEWHTPANTLSVKIPNTPVSVWGGGWKWGLAIVPALAAGGVLLRRWSTAARYRREKRAYLAGETVEPIARPILPPAWTPGSLIRSRYQIEIVLAQSNFSDVYGAKDTTSGEPVVLKRLRPPDFRGDLTPAWFRRRFTQEVAAMGMVRHPGVLPLLDTWIDEVGVPHLVMPRIVGPTLRAHLESSGKLPLEAARCLIRDIADILGAAHEQGVVHCDVKPENVMLRPNPHRSVFAFDTFVIDFGTSAIHPQSSILSQSSRPAGTAGYMAPEQILGRYSTATDVYSFAILSFEILTGSKYAALHLPFDDEWESELRAALLRFALPAAMAGVFVEGLCFDPNRRANQIREWADALLRAGE